MISDIPLTVGTQQYLCHIPTNLSPNPTVAFQNEWSLNPPKTAILEPKTNTTKTTEDVLIFSSTRNSKTWEVLAAKQKILQEAAGYCWNFSIKGQVVFPTFFENLPQKSFTYCLPVWKMSVCVYIFKLSEHWKVNAVHVNARLILKMVLKLVNFHFPASFLVHRCPDKPWFALSTRFPNLLNISLWQHGSVFWGL